MADFTLEQVVTRVQSELYQVAGPAVQVYSQDIIINRVNDAFIAFFDDKNIVWKRFLTYITYTLDGVNGEATTAVDAVFAQYEDIQFIYPSNSDRPLNKWNLNRNPVLMTSTQMLMVTPSSTAHKIFTVLPKTATGDVIVVGKSRPTGWPYNDLADIVAFDYLSLVYFVAWQMMIDDGANPTSADKLKTLFTNRYKEVELSQDKAPIALNGMSGQIPTTWTDRGA